MKPLKPVGFVELRTQRSCIVNHFIIRKFFADNVINDRSILCILQGKLNSCFFKKFNILHLDRIIKPLR